MCNLQLPPSSPYGSNAKAGLCEDVAHNSSFTLLQIKKEGIEASLFMSPFRALSPVYQAAVVSLQKLSTNELFFFRGFL